MSEFVANCPKCRQRILCDTEYVGMRVACPQCMQEIVMPTVPEFRPPAPSNVTAPATREVETKVAPGPSIGRNTIGALVTILAVGAFCIYHWSAPTSTQAQAKAEVRPVQNTSIENQPLHQTLTPRGAWTFDKSKGNVMEDSSGCGNNALLVGAQTAWTKDARVGSGALLLDGSEYVEAGGPVINTAQSFTVAAWVKFSEIESNHCQTIVSVDGREVSSFFLQYNGYGGSAFVFNRLAEDNSNGKPTYARASFAPSTNVWYHLAGVYNSDTQTIALYVNGKLQQTSNCRNVWQGRGKLAIGRGYYNQSPADKVHGVIDDVEVFDSALTEPQIKLLTFP